MNTPLRRSGIARVLKGSHSFTCTPRVHPLTEWTIPCLCLPNRNWYSFNDPGGWKAELALGCWWQLALHCQSKDYVRPLEVYLSRRRPNGAVPSALSGPSCPIPRGRTWAPCPWKCTRLSVHFPPDLSWQAKTGVRGRGTVSHSPI